MCAGGTRILTSRMEEPKSKKRISGGVLIKAYLRRQRTPKLRAGKTQIRQPKKNAWSKIPLFIRIQAQNSLSKVCRKSANYTKKRAFSGKRCIKKQPPKKTQNSPRSLYLSGLAGFLKSWMVGARGFEPPTSSSRTKRASQTALRPDIQKEWG